MSKTNEPNNQNNQVSPIRNLFRKDEDQYKRSEPAEKTGDIPKNKKQDDASSVNRQQTVPDESQSQNESGAARRSEGDSFFNKMKSRFSGFVNALKQQPESDDFDEDEDEYEEAPAETSEEPKKPSKIVLPPPRSKQNKPTDRPSTAEKTVNAASAENALSEADMKSDPKTSVEGSEAARSILKPEEKSAEAKQDIPAKTESKTEKPASKPEEKPAETKQDTPAKPESKTEKPVSKPEEKPGEAKQDTPAKTESKTDKPVSKPEEKPAEAKQDIPAKTEPKTEKTAVNQEEKPAEAKQDTPAKPEPKTDKPTTNPEKRSGEEKTLLPPEKKAVPELPVNKASKPVEGEKTAGSVARMTPPAPKQPVSSASERPKKEIPEFDIFAEFKKEQSGKTDPDQKAKSKEKANTAPSVADNPLIDSKLAPKTDAVKASEKANTAPSVTDNPLLDTKLTPKSDLPKPAPKANTAPSVTDNPLLDTKLTPKADAVKASEKANTAPSVTDNPLLDTKLTPKTDAVKASEKANTAPSVTDNPFLDTKLTPKLDLPKPAPKENTASEVSDNPLVESNIPDTPEKTEDMLQKAASGVPVEKTVLIQPSTESNNSDKNNSDSSTTDEKSEKKSETTATLPVVEPTVPVRDDTVVQSATTDQQSSETVSSIDAVPPAPQVPEVPRSKYTADDLPGGDGISIIPWDVPKRQPDPDNLIYNAEPQGESEPEPDLSEGQVAAVSYHYSNAEPFIVMAGKFTKTLRGEYEAVRIFRGTVAAPHRPPAPPAPPAPLKSEASARKKQKKAEKRQDKKSAAAVSAAAAAVTAASLPKAKATKQKSPFGRKKPAPQPQQAAKTETVSHKSPDNLSSVMSEAAVSVKDTEPLVPEPTKKKSSRYDRQKKAKVKKDKKKFRFGDLFSSEEEFDPDDVLQNDSENKPQLDDYNEEKDAVVIKTEISANFQTVFARTITLLCTAVASIILSLLGQCTTLFRDSMRNGWMWFAIISFLIFGIAVVVSRNTVVNGLMPLKKFRGNSDTAVAAASVACAIQSITAIFTPHVFLSNTLFIYTPLVILALFLNSLGKLLIIMRTHNNFSFLIKPYPKYAGKIYTDKQNAEKMTSDLPTHKAIIGYTRRSKFMSNFLQLSYAPDPSEEFASFLAPWTTLYSVISGILFGIINDSYVGGLSCFALTACMSIPMISLLAVNIPLRRLCKSTLRSGAMITGYETVKQFCDTNAIMIDSSQLYPKGSVTLSGMKSFKQSKLNEALLSGASIMYAVNGTMIHVFENIVQCSKDLLPKVDNVVYEDGKGLAGWVKGQRVLIGNRQLLLSHNIQPPDKEIEDRYLNMGNDVTYISVSGELIAMFILSYKTNKYVANELKNLEQNGVSFIVRTVDANITREKVAERFGLFHRCITILPTGLGNICHEVTSAVDERSRAYLVTRGKLSSFAKAVSGCIRMKSNVTFSKVLQGVALALGIGIVTMISFVSGFEKLGCLEMLIYIGFWSVTSIIATLIRK